MKTQILILIVALLTVPSTTAWAKSYDLVCGKVLAVESAFDDTGESILKIERRTPLTVKPMTFRLRLAQSPAAQKDHALVRNLSKSGEAFCAQSSDGRHLSRFSVIERKLRVSRIPGFSNTTKAKL